MSRNKAKTRVKTAKGRKTSSTRWLERQLNDPYVKEAEEQGLRSRAAFKIMEIDEKLGLFKSGQVVVDLGAAPGGWSQYAADKGCRVVALDLLPMDELPGVAFFQMDFTDDDAPETLIRATGDPAFAEGSGVAGGVDIVMSDMAPNTIGHKQTDHLRIMALVEMAYDFAVQVLKPDGAFVAKVFQGGAENTLLAQMKKDFRTVRHIKPPASRKESSEQYVVATGYRGS